MTARPAREWWTAAELAEASGARLAWVPRRAGERGALEAGSLPQDGGRDTAGILAAAAAEFFHYRALVFVGYVHGQVFVRLAFLTIDFTEYHARLTDCQFKAFATHIFN